MCIKFADFFDCSFVSYGVDYKFATKAALEKIIVKVFPKDNISVDNKKEVVSKYKSLIKKFINIK